MKSLSRVRLFATPWTVAHQAPPSVEFSRQEYWSGVPFPSPGDLPNPGIEPRSPPLQADALTAELPGRDQNKGSASQNSLTFNLFSSWSCLELADLTEVLVVPDRQTRTAWLCVYWRVCCMLCICLSLPRGWCYLSVLNVVGEVTYFHFFPTAPLLP